MTQHDTPPPLISVRGISKRYGSAQVLNDVSFDVAKGQTVSLVGESGSGKSTIARIVTGLERPNAGEVRFFGSPRPRRRSQQKALHRHVGVVLQDPYESIDPRFTVGEIVAEPLRAHGMYRGDGSKRVDQLLAAVGLEGVDQSALPHQFSGGQRQRLCIARALATDPEVVICDEPTSALDVSVQAQILNLLLRLQQEQDLAYLFISHDIGIVRRISDQIVVLDHGRIVEQGATRDVTDKPQHPYTQRLIAAVPSDSPHTRRLGCR